MQSKDGDKVVKKLLNAMLWAWSEAMGKYEGNPLWSEGAVASFRAYSEDCWKSKSQRSRPVPHSSRLVHEHIVPRKQVVNMLLDLDQGQPSRKMLVGSLFKRHAIGAVITRKEDGRLRDRKLTNGANGWDRYVKARIKFVAHTALPKSLGRRLKKMKLLA